MIKGEYDPKEHARILYAMELHESIKYSEELYVTRVPGGWIYDRCIFTGDLSSVFVSYNAEFKDPCVF